MSMMLLNNPYTLFIFLLALVSVLAVTLLLPSILPVAAVIYILISPVNAMAGVPDGGSAFTPPTTTSGLTPKDFYREVEKSSKVVINSGCMTYYTCNKVFTQAMFNSGSKGKNLL